MLKWDRLALPKTVETKTRGKAYEPRNTTNNPVSPRSGGCAANVGV
jgi:hypothetical protein